MPSDRHARRGGRRRSPRSAPCPDSGGAATGRARGRGRHHAGHGRREIAAGTSARAADRLPGHRRGRRRRHHRGADRAAPGRGAAVPGQAGIRGPGREADGALARRGRRNCWRPRRPRAPRWRSATPSASTRRWRRSCRSLTSPRFIEVHRLGTFPERSLDIDVVFDLMIHDLDVVLSLVRSDVVSIEAVGVPVLDRPSRHRQRPPALRERAASPT